MLPSQNLIEILLLILWRLITLWKSQQNFDTGNFIFFWFDTKRRKSRIKDSHKKRNLQYCMPIEFIFYNILNCVLSEINEVLSEDIRNTTIAEEKTPKQKVKLFDNFFFKTSMIVMRIIKSHYCFYHQSWQLVYMYFIFDFLTRYFVRDLINIGMD